MHERFRRFSGATAQLVGSTWAFAAAAGIVLMWALAGPLTGFSSWWQLVINTGTTIVTFLMVFVIQNTQNRDSKALHLKLDELVEKLAGPRDEMVDLEDAEDEELEEYAEEFRRRRAEVRDNGRGARARTVESQESTPAARR